MLGKQEYFCHQGRDYNKGKKDKYIEKKNVVLKQDHIFTKSRKHTKPTKNLGCPVKFCVKKIYRFTSCKVGIDTKNNREKINRNLRNYLETLNKNKKNCENLGSLQYLVIFPNENQHRFHYQGETATVIQPVDSKVNDFIRKQIREGCRVPKDIQSRTEHFVKETIFNRQKTKESKRRTFVPSRKKIRNLILSVRNETRHSKIDQENITLLKDKWLDYSDVFFEPFKKHVVVKEDEISGKQTYSYIRFYLSICTLVLFVFM